MFSGNAAYNTVQLDRVRVANNDWSGILLVFDDDTNSNTVIINDAEVIGNTAYSYNNGGAGTGGVCIKIASDSDSSKCPYNCPSGNTVNITNSRFISNVADSGGAIGAIVEANCDDSITLSINSVFLTITMQLIDQLYIRAV